MIELYNNAKIKELKDSFGKNKGYKFLGGVNYEKYRKFQGTLAVSFFNQKFYSYFWYPGILDSRIFIGGYRIYKGS